MLQVYESLSGPCVVNYIYQLYEAKNRTYGTRYKLQPQHPNISTTRYDGRNCIRYKASKIWNLLSNTVKLCKDKDSFIKAVRRMDHAVIVIYFKYRRSSHNFKLLYLYKHF